MALDAEDFDFQGLGDKLTQTILGSFNDATKKLNLSSGCIHIKSNINLTLQKCIDNYYDIVFIHSNTLKDELGDYNKKRKNLTETKID